jgi:Uma2 family endonuclease
MARVSERVAAYATSPDVATDDHGPLLEEQRVFLRDRSWREYEALLAMRGERAVPRIHYLDGEIELMAPGILHEDDKKKLARLVEAWADATGQYLDGFGSWTIKSERKRAGAEPDECYVLTKRPRSRLRRPDVAIEVVRTTGGIPKLEIYRKLGVREVWFWARGALRFFELRRGAYREIAASKLAPALPVRAIVRAMRKPDQPSALRALRASLR